MKRIRKTALCILALSFFLITICSCSPIDQPKPKPPELPQAQAPAEVADENFPETGPRSIFRHDFPFVTQEGEVSPYSVPPTRPGCGVKLLPDGEERLKWRLDLMGRSKKSIRVQTFIFTADDAGKKIADALKSLRKTGHDIRLTVDCYTKFMPADRLLYNDLEMNGIKVMGFEPAYLLGTVGKKILDVHDVNMRFHEKYFVIDDEAAIVGGTNIANEYFRHGDDPMDMWRDQDALLTGPVVQDIARAYDDNYEYFKLRRDNRLPTNRAAWFKKAWWEITGTAPPPVTIKPDTGRLDLTSADLDADNVNVRFLRHRPRQQEDFIFQAYLHLFDSAQKSILIENAYFVPNRALLNALMRAARRGVSVIVITNSDKTNDVSGMQPLSRYSYKGLIQNGVKVYEWQGDHPGKGSLHSKFAVIDNEVTILGSCNLDPRSLGINSENVIIIDSPAISKKLSGLVMSQDFSHSLLITLDQALSWHHPEEIEDKFSLTFGKTLEDWY